MALPPCRSCRMPSVARELCALCGTRFRRQGVYELWAAPKRKPGPVKAWIARLENPPPVERAVIRLRIARVRQEKERVWG